MFDCIVLSPERKFLSRTRCQDFQETARFVQIILQKDLVGSLSIKRVMLKEPERGADHGHP